MKPRQQSRSVLHLQMGQETIYLLLTFFIFSTVILLAYIARDLKARESTAVHTEVQRLREDPPIITLREADGFSFAPGSSVVEARFDQQIREQVVPRLRAMSRVYNAKIIEVIGHTDEMSLGDEVRRGSNLDATLLPLLAGRPTKPPVAWDNAGLGLARAVIVARLLREAGIGSEYTIVPLSAGAFLKPDDQVSEGLSPLPDPTRRRIEIRIRRPSRR